MSEQLSTACARRSPSTWPARDPLYVVDYFAGANPDHRVGVPVVTMRPYHALFAKTMFIVPTARELGRSTVDSVVLHLPDVEATPEQDGTRTETFVVLNLTRSEPRSAAPYAGEIKKGIFEPMNYRRPPAGCSPCTLRQTRGGKRSGDGRPRPLGHR